MSWLLIPLVVALVAGLAYFVIRRRGATAPVAPKVPALSPGRTAKPKSPPHSRFWGKQLVVPNPDDACLSARVLNGQSFAINKVPKLPLKDCGSVNCACRFEALVDRRADPERRCGLDRRDLIRFEDRKDRRHDHDRRKDDQYDWRFTV